MQGWDSVAVRADIEIGGTDQLFNFMVARDLQREDGQEAQVCITFPILVGTDGERRMGKSLNNYIGVGESAYDQFAKTMSIPDRLMAQWFQLLTNRPDSEVAPLIASKPMEAKKLLGRDIAGFYHGEEAAAAAQAEWERRFSEKQDPTDIAEFTVATSDVKDGKMKVVDLLAMTKLAESKSEARRAIEGGGVTVGPDKEKVTDVNAVVAVTDWLVVRIGKRKVIRLRVK